MLFTSKLSLGANDACRFHTCPPADEAVSIEVRPHALTVRQEYMDNITFGRIGSRSLFLIFVHVVQLVSSRYCQHLIFYNWLLLLLLMLFQFLGSR